MKTLPYLALLLTAAVLVTAQAANGPKINFELKEFDFGKIPQHCGFTIELTPAVIIVMHVKRVDHLKLNLETPFPTRQAPRRFMSVGLRLRSFPRCYSSL